MKKLTVTALILALLFSLALPAAAASVFTDHTNGNKLTVPTGWTATSLSSDHCEVELESASDGSGLMYYESIDLWEGLDPSTKASASRSQVNNDLFTKEEIADILGVDSREVSMVTLGQKEYFYADSVYNTTYDGYAVSVDVDTWVLIHNGWYYSYQFMGNTSGQLYRDFKSAIASATYGETSGSGSTGSSKESAYQQAVNNYNSGNYSTAYSQFQQLNGYQNSYDYMRLIRIRSYGENTGIGCVYDYRKALTNEEKADIDKAMQNFYFADTAEVLMCNTDVATYVLYGNWTTASNAPAYSYLKWHKDSAGGYYYTRSNNLSTAISDCVSINDGYVRVSITSSNTLVFHIKLTGPNSMSLYCYEYGKCVELFRQ